VILDGACEGRRVNLRQRKDDERGVRSEMRWCLRREEVQVEAEEGRRARSEE
jgi:hypothetical protein